MEMRRDGNSLAPFKLKQCKRGQEKSQALLVGSKRDFSTMMGAKAAAGDSGDGKPTVLL